MKLTTKGRYAVMAMADLAAQDAGAPAETRAPVTLSAIAERQDISLAYLEQLFGKLRREGLVESVRGPGGGYRLARPARDIRISDIIYAAEEEILTTRCAPHSDIGCTGEAARCLTHDLWEALGRQIMMFFDAVTLQDVVAGRVAGARRASASHDGEKMEAQGAAPS